MSDVGCLLFVLWASVLTLTLCLVNLTDMHENVYLEIFELMFRIGSIIFGGGQVVLPLLEDEVVPSWMNRNQFLQGLGLAQSLPGPLFNFSAYLGAIYQGNVWGCPRGVGRIVRTGCVVNFCHGTFIGLSFATRDGLPFHLD